MARHVVLTFQSNEEAEDFVKAVQAASEEIPLAFIGLEEGDAYIVKSVEKGVEVLGMFAKPTQFCDCARPTESSVRGAKWGWFLDPRCAKPKRKVWQYPKNLLQKLSNKELMGPGKDDRLVTLGIQEGYEDYPHQLIDLNEAPND
jgi:hypothetical protein